MTLSPPTPESPNTRDALAHNSRRIAAVWQEMLDEPQDPATARRIATHGKRSDKD